MLNKGYEQKDIAKALSRASSTICDEVKRNSVNGNYQPQKAHHKAYVRRKNAKYQGKKIVATLELKRYVEQQLYLDQSPEAIGGRLKYKREPNLPYVSKDSIYRYIKSPYGRNIEIYRKSRKRRRYSRKRKRILKLQDRTFVDKRPKSINERAHTGHCEADFIVSGKTGKGVLLVIVDRKLRAAFIEQIINTTILNVHQAFLKIKKRFPEMKSVTTDNDILLKKHQELKKLIKIKIYFCHPYHAWEKGTVENTNMQIRKHIPKGSDISKYSKSFIKKVENKLNNRILRCLYYLTPAEVVEQYRKTKKR